MKLLFFIALVFSGAISAQEKYVTISWPQVMTLSDGSQMTPAEVANLDYTLYTVALNDPDPVADSVYLADVWAYYCAALPAPCSYQTWMYSFRPCVFATVFDSSLPAPQRFSHMSNIVCVTF